MNEELFNEASKSNILSKQLVNQLQESMTYSSISFINWTIEVLKLLKARIERGDKIKDETTGVIYGHVLGKSKEELEELKKKNAI